ncbi:MAG: hypothetical protein KF861_10125 [Planctomycetaceae bacterium]|nr:hypothetical protein [Planctomycetaceae bacterium]
MIRHVGVAVCLIAAHVFVGCSKPERPKTEPTFPVSGTVTIDGKPTPGVKVWMFKEAEAPGYVDPVLGAPHMGETGADGKFQITTYNTGDGAPVGDYVFGFFWQGNPKVVPFAIPDEVPVDRAAAGFNRKYGDPTRTGIKVKVEEGKSADLGVLDLKTK